MSTTRVEIASNIGTAFAAGPADKSKLLSSAVASQAPPAVIETLATLPERNYASLRDLWKYLEGVPVDR